MIADFIHLFIIALNCVTLYLLSTTSEFMAVNHPRPRRFTAINSDVVDNKCYIPYGNEKY